MLSEVRGKGLTEPDASQVTAPKLSVWLSCQVVSNLGLDSANNALGDFTKIAGELPALHVKSQITYIPFGQGGTGMRGIGALVQWVFREYAVLGWRGSSI